VQADCIDMLKATLQREEERAWNVFMEAKLIIARLEDDYGSKYVKVAASQYWRAARDVEEALQKHRQSKYALEVPLAIKTNIYEYMIECMKQLKEKESQYKEALERANGFVVQEFRPVIERLVSTLMPRPAESPSLQSLASPSSNHGEKDRS
jgi:hypothetical protein